MTTDYLNDFVGVSRLSPTLVRRRLLLFAVFLACPTLPAMAAFPGPELGGLICAAGSPTQDSLSTRAAAKPVAMSTTGTRNVIAIFAKFAGEADELMQAPAWSADFFDTGRPGSFSHFYLAMSFGQLRITGEVAPTWYSSRRPASAYVVPTHTEPGGFGEFSLEILRQADADIDFSRFDNDGRDAIPSSGDDDGSVDAVF